MRSPPTANLRALLLAAICALSPLPAVSGAIPARGTEPGHAAAGLPRVAIDMRQATLENGLRVIVVEDHALPIVSLGLVYDVGAANEQKGRTGFAHLFEHLMFQGSKNVAPGEHMELVAKVGGNLNATTGTDWTFYFEMVPSNQLDLALFLEADRLRSLDISQHNLTKEIEVVKEERRLRFDNQPYGTSRLLMEELLYDSFAYSHDGVGSMTDLGAASLEDVRSFFNTYYRASNLVLVVVGDVRPDEALGKVKHYFGDLPKLPDPPQADRTEPRQAAATRTVLVDPLAPRPQLRYAYKAISGEHPDFWPLTVLASVMTDGHSARLYQALLQRRDLASEISGGVDERRAAGSLQIIATLSRNDGVEATEQAIADEIARLQREPIADWELEKAKNTVAVAFASLLRSGIRRALAIGAYTVDFDDPQRVNDYLDNIGAVTADDVQRVARIYLRDENRTELVTMPKPTGDAP